MNFIKRIISTISINRFPIGFINAILFTLLRNHPLKKGTFLARCLPYLHLYPTIFKKNKILIDTCNFSHFIIADEFISHQIYDLNPINFIPDLIYDCGAHIGMFSILANAYFPAASIYSFEPMPNNVVMLKKQLKINNISKINIIPSAVSITNGETIFFESSSSFGGSLHDSHNPDEINKTKIPVALINLKEWIVKHNPTKFLLKIDIEGEEESVIPHILPVLPNTCAIFFETHSIDGKKKLLELLKANNYEVQLIRELGIYADHFAFKKQ